MARNTPRRPGPRPAPGLPAPCGSADHNACFCRGDIPGKGPDHGRCSGVTDRRTRAARRGGHRAGFAGMYMLYRLRGQGFSVHGFERATASAAPGTGTATRARAATSRACNIPTRSPTSCSRNGAGANATPAQPEILALRWNHVADRFDLRTDIHLRHPGDRASNTTRRPNRGRVRTEPRRHRDRAIRHHRGGLPVHARTCPSSRARTASPAPRYHTGDVAARGRWTSPASGSA